MDYIGQSEINRSLDELLTTTGAERKPLHIAIGPVVFGGSSVEPVWYFVAFFGVAGGGSKATSFGHCGDVEIVDNLRRLVCAEIFWNFRPALAHDFDSELDLAIFVAATWPCPEATAMVAEMQAEQTVH